MSAVAHIDEYKTGRYFSEEFRGDMSWNGYENNVLLHNLGPGMDGLPRFADVGFALGADSIDDARGIAIADFDNDGDLDIAVNHNPGDNGRHGVAPKLYLNHLGQDRNWLAVELKGAANREAIGAEVTARAGPLLVHRLLSCGSSYAGQHSKRLYFGLAHQERVEELTVRWPGGETEVFEDLAVNRLWRITKGSPAQSVSLPRLKPRTAPPSAQ
jgi:hypothetical protein